MKLLFLAIHKLKLFRVSIGFKYKSCSFEESKIYTNNYTFSNNFFLSQGIVYVNELLSNLKQ